MTSWADKIETDDLGFSLVELLVVVFIVGLMSSVVVLSLSEKENSLSKSADEVVLMTVKLQREAILKGRPIRWSVSSTHSSVEEYLDREWILLSDPSRVYAGFGLSEDVDFNIELTDFAARSSPMAVETNRGSDINRSALIFLPSGEVSAANITLSGFDRNIALSLSPDGRVERRD